MKRRVLPFIAIAVLLCLAGAAALAGASAPHAYSRVVYHFVVSEVDVSAQGARSTPVPPYEEWVDPAGPYLSFGPRQRSGAIVLRDGYQYPSDPRVPVDPLFWVCHQDLARSLRRGFAGQGLYYLARAHGPVVETRLNGARALRFSVIECFSGAVETMWIDAVTHVVRQTQTTAGGAATMLIYSDPRTFAMGSLPGTFFDPPRASPSFWQRLQDWIGSHARR